MTPEQWEKVSEIYHSALELGFSERKAFLDEICAGDEALRLEVESLLEADREAGDFIARPAFHDAASLLTIKPDTPLQTGQDLAHYRIISRLGAGGMGEVYLARDSRLNREVAVKILPASFAGNPNYLRRFQTEAEAAATLNHPNVAVIYSVEKTVGRSFITMEYVAGQTLDASIPADGFDLKTFLELFIPLADALAHAHAQSVIHRDIKPGNIIITPAGKPKILDFGLAQIARPKSDEEESTLKITEPGQIFGTPSYMSPEQAEGKQVDHRSDIFSFGVVMYEAITGARPFQGDNYASIISNLLKTEPVSVSEIKPETPYLLARLINRCLRKSRRERFQSMSEVRAILEEIKAALEAGISMDSSTSNPFLLKQKSVSRLWLIAPAVLIIALSVSAYYFFRQISSPESPINFANMTLRKLSQTNNVIIAQITPDGKSVVYNTIEENDTRGLWIRRVEEKNALQLLAPQPVSFWGGLMVSNDGSRVFYIIADKDARHGTLYSISSLGGAPRKLVEKVNDLGSVSPDGERVLLVRYGERSELLSAKTADGSDERLIQTSESNQLFRDPQFSADGKSIFSIKFERINGEEFWSLVEIPATGGAERKLIAPRKERIGEIAVLKDGSGLLMNGTDSASNLAQLFYVSVTDGKFRRITNDLHSYFAISVSSDGKTIAAAQRNFARDIYVTEGAETKKLTIESNIHSTAVFAPDGRIVYDAADNNRPHIWIMNPDGKDAHQLTPNDSADFEPRVSRDGRFIFFTSERTGERKIWRMNIDGSNPQLLTPVSGVTTTPLVLPDGENILFTWAKENKKVLGKISVNGGEISELNYFGERLLTISPDGKQIAYVFFDDREKRYKVGVSAIENSAAVTVFKISPVYVLLWAADGKSLLYRDLEPNRASVSTLWQQPLAGGAPKPFLTTSPDSIFAVSQSNDGKKTAVVREKLLSDAVLLTRINEN